MDKLAGEGSQPVAPSHPWDWPEPKFRRRLSTVRERILWSYALLSVSRQRMKLGEHGSNSRSRDANILMSRMLSGDIRMRSLERDDAQSQEALRFCVHCGTSHGPFHWDHLIPRASLEGITVPYNIVRACQSCNCRRGATDLMIWYRQERRFPALNVLRRYLKVVWQLCEVRRVLDLGHEETARGVVPIDLLALPRRFPPVEQLRLNADGS